METTQKQIWLIQRRPKLRLEGHDKWHEWDAFTVTLDEVRDELQYNKDNNPEDEWRIIRRITTIRDQEIE